MIFDGKKDVSSRIKNLYLSILNRVMYGHEIFIFFHVHVTK
ncbi:hypothetical protein HMPREF1987_01249 [Peptostreptococcaceae bacterium oral taxon 113 str. W5053]|nr:hypothetical protein HMPREF1987_01249 [Peptostreptococcaceae bacterium oral taxon 113 str. W5053]